MTNGVNLLLVFERYIVFCENIFPSSVFKDLLYIIYEILLDEKKNIFKKLQKF